jgi:hypothetical protein
MDCRIVGVKVVCPKAVDTGEKQQKERQELLNENQYTSLPARMAF